MSQLERDLGEAAQDEYWRTFLRNIKLHRFDLCAAPLPFQFKTSEVATAAIDHLRRSRLVYPVHSQRAWEVVDLLREMEGCEENPL
ncbi:MAG: hypothetical protein ACRERD_06780, partial [Candidatus Binatia bacterium]